MLEKVAKITGILASAAAVIAVVLFVLSKMDLSFIFGPKTYEAEYVPGVYTPDGYVSTFLGYKFTTPKDCELGNIELRAKQSKINVRNLSVTEMEAQMKKQNSIMDLFAQLPEGVNVVVSVQMEEKVSEKKFDEALKELISTYKSMGMNIPNGYEETEFLGKRCGKYEGYMIVSGVKANQEGYIFVENGYAWMLMFSYGDGFEEDVEKLKEAFEIYE